jgi:hypothetical protein
LGGIDVSVGSFSTEMDLPRHVRFTSGNDQTADIAGGPVRANNRHTEESYSMTSSARRDRDKGIVRPMSWAAFELMISLNVEA